MEYIVLDIETTDMTPNLGDIIQIYAARYIDGKEQDYFNTYVNSDEVDSFTTDLTGIKEQDVSNAPTLNEVRPYLLEYLGDIPIVGHRIKWFDLVWLAAKGIELRDGRMIIDTYQVAERTKMGVPNFQLETLKERFGVKTKSHNALNDARTTAIVFEEMKAMNPEWDVVERKTKKKKISSTIEVDLGSEDDDPFFDNLRFVVTGKFLGRYSRKEIEAMIKIHGGRVTGSVSRKTDYLIVGIQTAKNLVDGVHSSKELDCHKLQADGVDIYQLDGEGFEKLLDSSRR